MRRVAYDSRIPYNSFDPTCTQAGAHPSMHQHLAPRAPPLLSRDPDLRFERGKVRRVPLVKAVTTRRAPPPGTQQPLQGAAWKFRGEPGQFSLTRQPQTPSPWSANHAFGYVLHLCTLWQPWSGLGARIMAQTHNPQGGGPPSLGLPCSLLKAPPVPQACRNVKENSCKRRLEPISGAGA